MVQHNFEGPSDLLDVSFNTETIKRRSVQGAAATLAVQLVKFAVQFGTQIVLIRLLDPAQFGLVAMTAPVLGFVQTINDLGLGQAVVQQNSITQVQVSGLFWLNAALSAALTVVVALTAPAFAWFYDEPQVTGLIEALGCLILVSGLTIIPTALLNRQMRFIPLAIVELMGVVAAAVAGIGAGLAGFGVWALVLSQVATSATACLLAWAFAGWRPSWPARQEGLGGLLRFGAHLTGANFATYLSVSVDRVLIGALVGKIALGLYDRSYRLVVLPLTQLMAPASRIAVPLLCRLNGSDERFARAYLQMLQLTLLLSTPVMLVNIVMARPVVGVVFGDKWLEAVPIFAWICFGGLASSTFASTSWLFTSLGRTRQQMHYTALTSLISVGSFAIGVIWGAVGVSAVSASTFLFVQTPILVWAATREGPVTLQEFRRALLPFGLAGVVTVAGLIALQRGITTVTFADILRDEAFAFLIFTAALACQPGGRAFLAGCLKQAAHFRRVETALP